MGVVFFNTMNANIITHKTAVKRERRTFLTCYRFEKWAVNHDNVIKTHTKTFPALAFSFVNTYESFGE